MAKLAVHAIFGMAMLAGGVPAAAEVTNSSDIGFTVQHQMAIAADPETVWAAMIAPSRYWSSDHSWSGNAENFYLVPQAGGCFCELIRTGATENIKSSAGSVQHMRVVYALEHKMLRLSGALGPLQSEAVAGTLTMLLQPQGANTVVRFTYKVGGYMEFPIAEIAPAVDGVIGEQLARLGSLFGSPVPPEADAPEASPEATPEKSAATESDESADSDPDDDPR